MQEAFLHYLWKYKKLDLSRLTTTAGETIVVKNVGQHNLLAGPDFFNAQIEIAGQHWAGNVEIHTASSDWFLHNHEQDKAYQNVILHVVWEHDTEVFRKNNTPIPTLQLKNYVNPQLLSNYKQLFNNKPTWINCESQFHTVSEFIVNNWLERLYLERLERKSKIINELLVQSKNNWEAVLFTLLAKGFGQKINNEAFVSLAQSVNFSIIRKLHSNPIQLEALLFGQAGLLEDDHQDAYYIQLQKEYKFLKQKFQLNNQGVLPMQFFKLRPPNFPTIRLSQLAMLYNKHQNLFSKLIELNDIEAFYNLFKVETSPYWKTHYTFGKTSKQVSKTISKPMVHLLLINTVIPIKFAYAKQHAASNNEELLKLIQQLPPEKNSIIAAYNNLQPVAKSALQSQALIQLKTEYCDKHKCLFCAIGNNLISQ
ncbi:DUF2851 family protein [Corallibacter sp.]|uniref:DUF2851 family protein n=1 Tax=Corallibacter sp. TaxID=2038084 RepID=UPI003A92C8E1